MQYWLSGGVGIALIVLVAGPGRAEPATCETGAAVTLHPIMATHKIPPYPPISVRLNEQGVTKLEVRIGSGGSVLDDRAIRSSSSDRLDHAALDYLKANWKWTTLENCHTAATSVQIDWILRSAPVDTTGGAVERPLRPLPSSFDNLTPEKQKVTLARRYLEEIHVSENLRKIQDAISAPAQEKFETYLVQIPEAARVAVAAAFEEALDEARITSTNKYLGRVTDYFASHVSQADLGDLVDFYATPEAQKSVLRPEEMMLANRQAISQFVLAHPGAMQAALAFLQSSLNQLSHSQQDKLALVADFRSRFCTKLHVLELRDTGCHAVATPSQGGANPIPISAPVASVSESREIIPPDAVPENPVPQPPGCTKNEAEMALWARANGYKYSGSCN